MGATLGCWKWCLERMRSIYHYEVGLETFWLAAAHKPWLFCVTDAYVYHRVVRRFSQCSTGIFYPEWSWNKLVIFSLRDVLNSTFCFHLGIQINELSETILNAALFKLTHYWQKWSVIAQCIFSHGCFAVQNFILVYSGKLQVCNYVSSVLWETEWYHCHKTYRTLNTGSFTSKVQ